eukprot:jgi/Mesvir1/20672/Mv14885-RA.1
MTPSRAAAMGIGGGAPPGTAFGAPPGTAAGRGMRPPSANRRPGTGLNNLEVAARPVTQQGMAGIRSGQQGPGRQVQDKSYFLNELRAKKQDLTSELERLETELNDYQKNSAQSAQLDRKNEALSKEVKTLRGELADHNIVLDKLGVDASPDDILADFKRLKDANDRERKVIDSIFTERAQKEAQTKEVEQQTAAHQREMESRLNDLAPDKRQQYQELSAENKRYAAELVRQEGILNELTRALNKMEEDFASNPIKQRALAIHEQIKASRNRKVELEAEEVKLKMSPEEHREQMIMKMRRDNADIARAEDQIKETQEAVSRYQAKLDAVNADIRENQGALGGQTDKYQELQAKDAELQAFIDGFDGARVQQVADMEATQKSIVALLDKVAKLQAMEANMPSKKRFKEMRDELQYKTMQMENAATTQSRLQGEMEARRGELDKISSLEDKISLELKGLVERIEVMQKEIATYSEVGALKEQAAAAYKKLEKDAAALEKRSASMKVGVQDKADVYAARKAQLSESELHGALEKLEEKMRSMETNIFSMAEYIESKSRETNYKPMLADISNMVAELNVCVQKAATQP